MRIITRTVWILSLVSCFADIASEMLYPIVPLYLQQIGFSVVWISLVFIAAIAGVLWSSMGSDVVFCFSAILTVVVMSYMGRLAEK